MTFMDGRSGAEHLIGELIGNQALLQSVVSGAETSKDEAGDTAKTEEKFDD